MAASRCMIFGGVRGWLLPLSSCSSPSLCTHSHHDPSASLQHSSSFCTLPLFNLINTASPYSSLNLNTSFPYHSYSPRISSSFSALVPSPVITTLTSKLHNVSKLILRPSYSHSPLVAPASRSYHVSPPFPSSFSHCIPTSFSSRLPSFSPRLSSSFSPRLSSSSFSPCLPSSSLPCFPSSFSPRLLSSYSPCLPSSTSPRPPQVLPHLIISPTLPPFLGSPIVCVLGRAPLLCYQARHIHGSASYNAHLRRPTHTLNHFPVATMSTSAKLADLKAKFTPPEDLRTKYTSNEVHRYMLDCMMAVGTPRPNAEALADVLLAADSRGHFSHGLNRLEMYVNDVRQGICAGGATPTIQKESVSTGLVHGNNGLGPVVGNFCIDLAVKKAKETGIGWICARGSNHYGIAGWYAMRATKEGMLGMSFTNTSPLVAPTRAKKAALGTNPLALSAPAKNGDSFVLDMATCVVAVGKIEVERRKEKPIPEGWAIDKNGMPTTNAAEGMNGALMPLGGSELHSGYKGYGLGMLVEIFCGLMSGGQYGPNVRRWMQTDREADLGQCFVAINPEFFAPGFEDRMSDLMDHCRSMEPADPEKPVLAAGDPERAHLEKIKKEGGITYHINQIKDSWRLAKALGVKPME